MVSKETGEREGPFTEEEIRGQVHNGIDTSGEVERSLSFNQGDNTKDLEPLSFFVLQRKGPHP